MLKTPLGRLRAIGLIEGISYLFLLGVAMPLKYVSNFPEPVKIVGSVHGLFFVLFLFAIAHVTFTHRWSFQKILGAFIASLIPFGTFVLDSRLRKDQQMDLTHNSKKR